MALRCAAEEVHRRGHLLRELSLCVEALAVQLLPAQCLAIHPFRIVWLVSFQHVKHRH
jgi:hypothetical protein